MSKLYLSYDELAALKLGARASEVLADAIQELHDELVKHEATGRKYRDVLDNDYSAAIQLCAQIRVSLHDIVGYIHRMEELAK